MKDLKIPLAVLFSVAIFLAVPNGQPPINNSEPKAAVTVQAHEATITPGDEPTAKNVTPVAKPAPAPAMETPAVQPEPNTPDAWMQAVGLSEPEKEAARYIIGQESGWCPTKWQGNYGSCPAYHGVPQGEVGYGLCQATPAHKMAAAGDDWATNPITQLKWCHQYVQEYGGWVAAADFKRCTGLCFSPRILATTHKATPWF